jgi:hypothetical protein
MQHAAQCHLLICLVHSRSRWCARLVMRLLQLTSCHSSVCRHGGCMPVAQADAAGAAAPGSTGADADATMAKAEEEAADEPPEVSEQSPMLDGQAALLSLRLLAAIAGYQRCLPGAMAGSHTDLGRLLPSVRFLQLVLDQSSGASKALKSAIC